jgi:hypothetical protein
MASHEQAETLIAATTEAAVAEFFVHHNFIVPIVANNLGASEVIAVEVYTLNGWAQYKSNGLSVGLSANTNKIGFDIPGRYRLNKPVTVAAVGVLRDMS